MRPWVIRAALVWSVICAAPFSDAGRASEVSATRFESLTYLTEIFPPYNYEEDGELKGISVDLLNLVWDELEVRAQKIVVYPWPRAYAHLQRNEEAVLFAMARTHQRELMFKWACPIYGESKTVLLARKDRGIRIDDLEDAKAYRIGTSQTDAAEQILVGEGFGKNSLQPSSDLQSALRKLHRGRVDLVAGAEGAALEMMGTIGLDRADFETVFAIRADPSCYAFNKEAPDDLVAAFQLALERARRRPEYSQLVEKYFPGAE